MECGKCPIQKECHAIYFQYWNECPLTKTVWSVMSRDIIDEVAAHEGINGLKKLVEKVKDISEGR